MKKVLIPTKLDPVAKHTLETHGGYTVHQEEGANLIGLAADHPEAYALIVRSEKVDSEVIDAFPDLRVVIRAGAGYNTIDTAYARKKRIDVMNTPGANSNAVAEEVVALILADARHLIPAEASCREGKWEKSKYMGRELTGKTLGILGLGHIGRLLVKRLGGFDLRVLAYDPLVSEERAADIGVELVSLQDLFLQSDYISLHIPENDHTRGMIDAELVGLMKPGATLINCARAGVLDEDAFRELKPQKGLRLLNDVYPKDEAGGKTVTDIADIMVPHLGASTVEANRNAARLAAQELIDFDDKGITSCIVNRDIPAGLDEGFADLAFTLCHLARSIIGFEFHLDRIEASIYGNLKPYAEWLIVPMVCAVNPGFDRSLDHRAAHDYLKSKGINLINRDVDDAKGFENSITVDLFGCDRKVSVRGTVTEGRVVISRINDFDRLYVEASGHIVVFIYRDRPGVLAQIAGALADEDINIDDVRNPHNPSGEQSIALLYVNRQVPDAVLCKLKGEIDASVAVHHHFV